MIKPTISDHVVRRGYAEYWCVIAQVSGTGKSARVEAFLLDKEAQRSYLTFTGQMETTSPRYQERCGKTKHIRLGQRQLRQWLCETGISLPVIASWRKTDWEGLHETFREETGCVMTQAEKDENPDYPLYNEGHFGEWMLCRHYGMAWRYQDYDYRDSADITTPEGMSLEVKTLTKGKAQCQPCINKSL